MKKKISYIFPIYNEEGTILVLYKTLVKLLGQHSKYNFEFIFINDGSTDYSLEILLSLQTDDDRISIINFSRNFGHQIAVTAGLDYSSSDAAIIMDSDLQDPPKVSLELIDKWEEGYEVVYAQRRSRKDNFFKKTSASAFYRILQKLADIDIPRDTGDFRLLDRKVVDALGEFRERERFLRGLISFVGFNQTGVLFDRDQRYAGDSGYPLRRMLHFAMNGILGFSTAPLKLISQLGYLISAASFVGIIYTVLVKMLDPKKAVAGWAFTVIAILLIGGIQMIMLGVLGSYIGRIYGESQGRPLYVISAIYSKRKE